MFEDNDPSADLSRHLRLHDGVRLDAWRHQLPHRPAILRMFLKICEAVSFANAGGVVHRDLRPENIMVGPFSEALVMNRAIEPEPAGPGGAGPGASGHGGPPASASFKAPEQVRGGSGEGDLRIVDLAGRRTSADAAVPHLDERTDVYALGAILYFLLTGLPPFDSDDPAELVRQVLNDKPAPPRFIDPHCPRPLQAVCLKALAKDPAARYGSAAELARDIERYLDGIAVLAHPESLIEKTVRLLGHNRTILYLFIAFLFIRLLVLVVLDK